MRRAVPLWPIWTIMATARLDHSRVLVTKFHQNRSTLKGRSASQRHTDRHTQTDRQTRLKIRALQVCNRANKPVGFYGPIGPQFRMPPVHGSVVRIRGIMRMQRFWICTSLSSTAAGRHHAASTAAARYNLQGVAGMANFKTYLLHQFCYNTQETQTQKMMDHNFEIRIL